MAKKDKISGKSARKKTPEYLRKGSKKQDKAELRLDIRIIVTIMVPYKTSNYPEN